MNIVKDIFKQIWYKAILDERGDLVQNIMWLAFIALTCVTVVSTLGGSLKSAISQFNTELSNTLKSNP